MVNLWVSSAVRLEGDEQAMVVKGTVTREQLVVEQLTGALVLVQRVHGYFPGAL